MKSALRVCGLTLLLVLVGLTTELPANPYDPCTCRIWCKDGFQTSFQTDGSCCQMFMNICGGYGTAYCEYSNQPDLHCFSMP